jgi:hypothetical protein
MRMIAVASHSIAAVGYESGTLVIAFRRGGLYRYSGVPGAVANRLLSSESKGRYYQSFIRGRYPSVRIG